MTEVLGKCEKMIREGVKCGGDIILDWNGDPFCPECYTDEQEALDPGVIQRNRRKTAKKTAKK